MDKLTLETRVKGIEPIEPGRLEESDLTGVVDVRFRLLRNDGEPVGVADVRVFLIEQNRNISLDSLIDQAIKTALRLCASIGRAGEQPDGSGPDAGSRSEWFR